MKKILIIEDTKTYAAIIAAHIENELGLAFDIAETKQQAAEYLATGRDDYCLATVDLHLPDSPSGEIMDAIAPFKIPAIVLTGDMSDSLREDILSYKFVCDYVLKKTPNSFEFVVASMRRLLRNMKTTVMVVEDSRVARRLLVEVLEAQLLKVIAVESAEKGLEEMKARPNVRLVIADGELEGMSGIELTHQIRRKYSHHHLAIIGVSGVYNSKQSISFLKAGANDFLAKPFNNEELITRINQNLDHMFDLVQLREFSEAQNLLMQMVNQDIYDPLSSIQSLTQLAEQLSDQPDKLTRCLNSIGDSTTTMLKVLNGVQQYSKIVTKPELKWSTFVLDDAWRVVEDVIMDSANSKQITVDVEWVYEPLHADRSQIAQVIANYLEISLKWSQPDSRVWITSELIAEHLWIRVYNCGDKLKAQDAEMLYKPFARLQRQGELQSVGLGLALAKKIVEQHNGSVGFESLEDAHEATNCFWFNLPI